LHHDLFGLRAVPPETARDQEKQTKPEKQAALPLQVCFPENAFEGTIRQGKADG
jgi:hypothetical protein